ncbi:MAG: TlpA disulfide reductase family protein [bacterium]|nr:TlpA disulfide reductase family protein [bacterium]
MTRKAVVSLVLLALLAGGCLWPGRPAGPTTPAGDPAPDFELVDLAGKRVRLSELVRQGPVVLNFWATWCGPCVRELPELEDLHLEFVGQGLIVVGVSLDANPAAVRQHLGREPVSFLVLLDSQGEVAERYGVSGIPHNFVIGPDMTIRWSKVGYSPGLADLRKAAVAALKEGK